MQSFPYEVIYFTFLQQELLWWINIISNAILLSVHCHFFRNRAKNGKTMCKARDRLQTSPLMLSEFKRNLEWNLGTISTITIQSYLNSLSWCELSNNDEDVLKDKIIPYWHRIVLLFIHSFSSYKPGFWDIP